MKDLLKIKSIITLVMLGVFTFLSIKGTVSPEVVMLTVTSVLTYYFVKADKLNK